MYVDLPTIQQRLDGSLKTTVHQLTFTKPSSIGFNSCVSRPAAADLTSAYSFVTRLLNPITTSAFVNRSEMPLLKS